MKLIYFRSTFLEIKKDKSLSATITTSRKREHYVFLYKTVAMVFESSLCRLASRR